MGQLIELLFSPPPIPEGLLSGVTDAIVAAFRLAYYRGVLDGFFAGALLAMLLILPRRGGR
jgi:hypothetical protein